MKILSVSELTQEIKNQLEKNFTSISVKGEILNLKIQSSGHIYFTLKDRDSQISAVLFKGASKGISRPLKEGDSVLVKGEVTVYSPRGTYQILVREITYNGVGELLAMLHERKNRLQALGYFAKEKKKQLPAFPKIIGVVTSPTGAVIQDIIHVLQRRHSGFHLILNPVKVQGDGAKEEIAKAIDDFNKYNLVDLIIVGRGGGSLEDLWAFNEEIVVEAIVRSTIPIISAVGHETDFSLCDFAADVRAPTPSAAAEIALTAKEEYAKFLLQAQNKADAYTSALLLRLKKQLTGISKNPYVISPYLLLSRRIQSLDDIKNQITLSTNTFLKQKKLELLSLDKQKKALEPSYKIQNTKNKLCTLKNAYLSTLTHLLRERKKIFKKEELQKKLDTAFISSINKKKENLYKLSAHLTSIDPKNLLTKGYCILFSENQDSVILSTKQVSLSQNLKLLLQDGVITAKTEKISYEPT